MEIQTAQLLADRDRQFADWGETITFREVSQAYTPQTQHVAETYVDTELISVTGAGGSKPSPGTGGQHLSDQIVLLVRAEDLPTGSPTPTSRVVHRDVEYDVISFGLSSQNLTYTLTCRRK